MSGISFLVASIQMKFFSRPFTGLQCQFSNIYRHFKFHVSNIIFRVNLTICGFGSCSTPVSNGLLN